MRRCAGALVLAALSGVLLVGGGPIPRPAMEPRRWWEVVAADLERFNRPIYDPKAESKPGEKPLLRGARFICPHAGAGRLQARLIREDPPGVMDGLAVRAYYCEIEGIYWIHVRGGVAGLNLVTGPYTPGVAAVATGPATRPATRPTNGGDLDLRLERVDDPDPAQPARTIDLALVLTNPGPGPTWINVNPALARVSLRIQGPRVETQPLGPSAAEPPRKADFVRLEAGASHRLVIRDLTTDRIRYRLVLPGAYVIRATYENAHEGSAVGVSAWTGSVTSPPLVVPHTGQPR